MTDFSRRNFLKFGALVPLGLAFPKMLNPYRYQQEIAGDEMVGRITIASVSVYKEPWDKSPILYQRYRDELVNLYEEVHSQKGPVYNPKWYRVWGGYIHSARVQLVKVRTNPVVEKLPEDGQLGEITVPVTYPLQFDVKGNLKRLYPIYYQSVFWITGVSEQLDKMPFYEITEAWSKEKYYVPGEHVRLIPPEELTPLSPDVPAHKKRIEISISRQMLFAFENDKEVFKAQVSTGLDKEVPGQLPWRTPTGEHRVMSKMASQRMGDDPITSDISGYVLPGVPWVSYFYETGVAIHGTYWHDNFGVAMSHGCVNMRSDEAKWVYRWTTPAPIPNKRETRGMGTVVLVR